MSWKDDADFIRSKKPQHILFLCVANSARSQIAEGIFRKFSNGKIQVSSAGSKPTKVNPLAIQVMKEIEINISNHKSKSVDSINPESIDIVITLCAEEDCPVFLGKASRFHWGLPDPTPNIESFRSTRNELYDRISYLLR